MDCLSVNGVIFGGGAAGLWLLGALCRAGRSAVLIETSALGTGQTISSQGILHSGLKYSLQGLLTAAARKAREMPAVWRTHLHGAAFPDLSRVEVRSQSFYLWGTDSAASRLGLFGARLGLHVTPQAVVGGDRPQLLRGCGGSVYRVDEQVISPASLLEALARPHGERIIRVDPAGIEFDCTSPGTVRAIDLTSPDGRSRVRLRPDAVVFTAGSGNAGLREAVGLDPARMQHRPLHMLLGRGALPEFYGHCVDGARTRVSITSGRDLAGRTVWQVGGQIAEDGVAWDDATLIARGQRELRDVFPDFDLRGTEWSTYRVDRAEGKTATGGRPDSYKLLQEGNVLTAWPTKLVLVPQLATAVTASVTKADPHSVDLAEAFAGWPRPGVSPPPWDVPRTWASLVTGHRTAA